ncbi:MAG: hypothetical protein A2W00_04535 [Candidatus Eisenbacteria bacterium RBG_16_71_46]|nr:MAG: hypothetical protein A2W00_04535 [Candidatus Eisenbacteria bacterium RBG_16_71_46]
MRLEDLIQLYAQVLATGALADAQLRTVGEETTVDITNAQKLNFLLVKGKGGARYRIDGLHVTRER